MLRHFHKRKIDFKLLKKHAIERNINAGHLAYMLQLANRLTKEKERKCLSIGPAYFRMNDSIGICVIT